MPSPHAVSLRSRVVEAHQNGEGTYSELATRFKGGRASVSRWLRREREGNLAPTSRRRPLPSLQKLTPEALELLEETLLDVPDSTQPELAQMLKDDLGIEVSRVTVGRWIQRLGFSRKRGLYDRQSATETMS
jgi:transposase